MSSYRLNDAGEVDPSFTPPPGDIRNLKLHGSYLYFATGGSNLSPDGGINLWKYGRLDAATGTLDEAWSPPSTGDYDVYGLDVDASGNAVIGLSAYSFPWTYRPVIKLLSDGSEDLSFTCPEFSSGAPSAEAYSVLFQDDGKIVVGGQFNGISSSSRYAVARLGTDGTLDTSLGALASDEIGNVSVLTKGGGFVWAGSQSFYTSGFVEQARVVKINPSGSYEAIDIRLLAPFDTPIVSALHVDSSGRLYIGGRFYELLVDDVSCNVLYLARINSDGTWDSTFTPEFNNIPTAVKVRSDGKILVAGNFTTVNGSGRSGQVLLSDAGVVL
jgi:uncharacterized delta-60 repeat protein